MSDESQERRQFSRILFDAWAELQQGEKSWQAAVVDVSLKGLLVQEPVGWAIDMSQPVHAAIRLDPSASIQMSAMCRHRAKGLIGFECQHIDIDSISNLRRLVELNLGDPELLERQLGALGQVS